MDPAILSAVSVLAGPLIGGGATFATSWLALRGQLRAQTLAHEAVEREALYAEFIIEASKRLTDAWTARPKVLKSSRVFTPPWNGCA
jgi:hypothetical protein